MPGTGSDEHPNTLANNWPKIFRQVCVPAAEPQHDQRWHVAHAHSPCSYSYDTYEYTLRC
jgi:hypothetical protein